ncbi:DUF2637 domain-containing protein [Streptomyces sp. NBC_00582]|uniref:DUF2637 domain-containing protein n=1 Tax=Streptomyces sp. NBC_00582 TaxID=2975783 RepID=UPI0010E75B15|nr:DUF2637 domain-containing protein [Streptomyces sp. NBC_00582]WUB63106.1 DUF2637 domain-containing protein [Streptomyces sp. NBC_00582]
MDGFYNAEISYDPTFDTIDLQWDPAEELAQMLSGGSGASVTGPDPTRPAGSGHRPTGRAGHRKMRRQLQAESGRQPESERNAPVTILIAMISVCAVCMLGWSFSYSYAQLRGTASAVLPPRLAQWWPLTVYGPWLVAALSVLRATVQGRSARGSWCVLLGASAMAVSLCITHASHSLLSLVIFGIPPITALVCFWEIVGQVSPKAAKPRHAAHGRRTPEPPGTCIVL